MFVWLSGIRWAIEQCLGEAKREVGMDQYEVRKYPAWNHHMLICMLAHFFLWHEMIRLGKKAPHITVSQMRMLLSAILPMKTLNTQELINLVLWIEIRNHRAYLSHRKHKLKKGAGHDAL